MPRYFVGLNNFWTLTYVTFCNIYRKKRPYNVISESEKEEILRKKAEMEQQIRTLNKQIKMEETVRNTVRDNPQLRELIARRYGNIYI